VARQRRYFFYLSGCPLADSYLTYEMESEKLTLFIPPIEPDEVMWSGLPETVEEAMKKYVGFLFGFHVIGSPSRLPIYFSCPLSVPIVSTPSASS
jgi:hypothetical protein